MRGAVIYGPWDVRLEERDDPKIIEPTDAIIRLSVPEIDPCPCPRPHVSAHSSTQGRGSPSAGRHVCGRVGCLMTETRRDGKPSRPAPDTSE